MATLCEWGGNYSSHGNYDYCEVESTVPLGCPAHVIAGDGYPVEALGDRNGTAVDLTGTVTREPFTASVRTTDVYTCTCERVTVGANLDRVTVELVGAQTGDWVGLGTAGIYIGPPGPCPEVEWPVNFQENVACDLCPEPPPEEEPGGPLGGCNAGGASSLMFNIAIVILLYRRRRRGQK